MKTTTALSNWLKVLAATIILSVSFSSQAVDIFLVLDDINGESNDARFDGAIDVLAFSEGLSVSVGAARDRQVGKPNGSDLSITKWLDAASPILRSALVSGRVIPNGKLSVRRNGANGFVYFEIELKNIYITSAATGGSGGEDRLTENISLTYETIRWIYTQVDDRGRPTNTFSAGYDYKEGRVLP